MNFTLSLVILAVAALCNAINAQTFANFPAGYDNKPEQVLKGPIHTVLTIEQREEHVFSTVVDAYDEKGRITESLSSNANIEIHSGKLVRLGVKTTFIYTAAGQLVRSNRFGPEGESWGYDLYKYDDKGRLVEIALFDKEGKSRGWERYAYAPDKREVEATWQFIYSGEPPRGKPMRSILKYDEANRWMSRTVFLSDNDTVTFGYDGQGNFVKEDHNGYGHTYTYEFDKYGNWIERIRAYYQLSDKSYNSPDDMHAYRVITYYPELLVK